MGWFGKLVQELVGPTAPQPHTQLNQQQLAEAEDEGYEAVFYDDGRFSHYAKRGLFKNVAEHPPKPGQSRRR